MTNTEELRLLAVVLKRIEQPTGMKSALWLKVCVWLLMVVSFVALFGFASRVGPVIYVVAGISGFLGGHRQLHSHTRAISGAMASLSAIRQGGRDQTSHRRAET
jgi:hypothetical protein